MGNKLTFRALLGPEGFERDRTIEIDSGGTITATGPGGPPFDGFVALPGMPNAHSHAFQRALTGRGEAARGEDSFWSWRQAMYRLAGRMDPEDTYTIARCAYGEMLAAGFTHAAEFHYLHHGRDGERGPEMADAICRAADDAGLPLTLLPVYYRTSGLDGAPARPEQRRFVHDSVDDFLRALGTLPRAPGGIAPHSLRAVPPEELPDLVAGADALLGPSAPIHIHVSEQIAEVEECLSRFGAPPIRVLADRVELGPRWSLVHATHATADERRLVRAAGPTAVLCPLTEAYLGDGLFEAREHMVEGGRMALGSDANVRISAIEELRLLEYGQRLRDRLRARLGGAHGLGATLWRHLAEGGGRAVAEPLGRIAAGFRADLVVLDEEAPALAGHHAETAIDAWLVGGTNEDIATVYVGGERVVDHGTPMSVPDDLDRFARTMRRLWSHG